MSSYIESGSTFCKKPIVIYFILAIGITWLFWIPTLVISTVNGYFVPSVFSFNSIIKEGFKDFNHVLVYSINQLGVYGPFLAAILTLFIFNRKDDLKNLFKKIIKWNVEIKWYIIIFLIPIIINLGCLGLAALLMADLSLAFNPGFYFPLILILFFVNFLTSGMEEPGWRGFAVPELIEDYSAYKTSIIVGIIWSIWHFPYVFYFNFVELGSGFYLTFLAMAGFTAITTFGSVIYSWIYVNTESLFILILFHTLQNIIPFLIMGGVVDPLGGFSTALFTLLLVFIIIKQYGETTLKGLEDDIKEKE